MIVAPGCDATRRCSSPASPASSAPSRSACSTTRWRTPTPLDTAGIIETPAGSGVYAATRQPRPIRGSTRCSGRSTAPPTPTRCRSTTCIVQPGELGLSYGTADELARILKIRAPTADQLAALERVPRVRRRVRSTPRSTGPTPIAGWQVQLATEVTLERAVEHWQQEEVPYGIWENALGPVVVGRDTWDRHALKLAPLKQNWGSREMAVVGRHRCQEIVEGARRPDHRRGRRRTTSAARPSRCGRSSSSTRRRPASTSTPPTRSASRTDTGRPANRDVWFTVRARVTPADVDAVAAAPAPADGPARRHVSVFAAILSDRTLGGRVARSARRRPDRRSSSTPRSAGEGYLIGCEWRTRMLL